MSYSFSILASSREKAKAMVAAKLDEVAAQQPVHRADREQALAAASAFIDVVEEPADGRELNVSVHGSVMWNGQSTAQQINGASIGVSVSTPTKRATQV